MLFLLLRFEDLIVYGVMLYSDIDLGVPSNNVNVISIDQLIVLGTLENYHITSQFVLVVNQIWILLFLEYYVVQTANQYQHLYEVQLSTLAFALSSSCFMFSFLLLNHYWVHILHISYPSSFFSCKCACVEACFIFTHCNLCTCYSYQCFLSFLWWSQCGGHP